MYVAIATSKPIARTLHFLKHYHMQRYFDCVIGEYNNEAQMGKAELVRRALPERCRRAVMVGDRKFDIEGAKANGIDSIGVRYGYGAQGELEAAGATHIVNSVEELLAMLCPGCKQPRGFFLTVEGLDGSGKTTQINRLFQSLTKLGYDTLQTREPGGCKISEDIRHLVLTTDNMEMSPPAKRYCTPRRARSMCTKSSARRWKRAGWFCATALWTVPSPIRAAAGSWASRRWGRSTRSRSGK